MYESDSEEQLKRIEERLERIEKGMKAPQAAFGYEYKSEKIRR